MVEKGMKSSVLKANEKLAKDLIANFRDMNTRPEYKRAGVEFWKKDIETYNDEVLKSGSFEIRLIKMVDGRRKGKTIFRFLKKEIGNEIQWNENFITI